MSTKQESGLLRIYIDEDRKHNGRPAYQAIVAYARKHGIAGVTVLRGLEGYGRSGKLHTENIVELSMNLPVVVEIIDSHERLEILLNDDEVKPILQDALITEENVKVISL